MHFSAPSPRVASLMIPCLFQAPSDSGRRSVLKQLGGMMRRLGTKSAAARMLLVVLVVLAGGTVGPDDTRISVEARRGDTSFGICSTPFLEVAFRTDYYRIDITFHDDDSWSYVTRTDLAIRGNTPAFNHQDSNKLRRIGQPTPNPLVGVLKGGAAG